MGGAGRDIRGESCSAANFIAEELERRQLLSVTSAAISAPSGSSVQEGNVAVMTLTASTDNGNGTWWDINTDDGNPDQGMFVPGPGPDNPTQPVSAEFDYTFPGDEGASYNVTAKVYNDDNPCGTPPDDSPYDATPQTIDITDDAISYQPFSSASAIEGDGNTSIPLGVLIDPDSGASPDDYANSTIQCGTGTPSAAQFASTDTDAEGNPIPQGSSAFLVMGTPTFPEQGLKSVSVTINDDGGQTASGATAVNVADAPLSAGPVDFNAAPTVAFSGTVATFTDADPGGQQGDYNATINWNDGATTAGAIANANGVDASAGFVVTGTHTYATAGYYGCVVSISDEGSSPAVVTSYGNVVAPQVYISKASDGSEDPDPDNPTAGPKPVVFTVSRTPDANRNFSGALQVSLGVSGGTADAGDYQTPDTTVTIPDGEASAQYEIKPIDDQDFGPDQTVDVSVNQEPAYQADGANAEGVIASNDFRIDGDSVSWTNSQGVAKDDGSGNYDSTQWVDMNGDGIPDSNADAYHSTAGAPVSYQATAAGSSQSMVVHVVMNAESGNPGSMPNGTYTIQGTDEGASGMTWEGTATLNGTTLTADLTSDQQVPSTILNGDMQIVWSVYRYVPDLSDVQLAPNSYDHLYVTGGAAAAAPKSFETVLDVGCRSASGDDPTRPTTVLNSIWSTFATNSIVAADGTTVLKYDHHPASDVTTASLVANKIGRCGAWGHFLVDVLGAQGVTAQAVEIVPPPSQIPGDTPVLYVKGAPAQGSNGVPYHTGAAYTINGVSATAFTDHVVVECNLMPGYVYDPSYGISEHDEIWDQPLSGRQVWEQRHLLAVGAVNAAGFGGWQPHNGYGLLATWQNIP